jgi:hypothetical protein
MCAVASATDHYQGREVSLLDDAARVESLTVLSRFRTDFHRCLTAPGLTRCLS